MQSSKDKAREIAMAHIEDTNSIIREAFDEYEAKLKIATKALEFISEIDKHGGVNQYPHCYEVADKALEALKGDV